MTLHARAEVPTDRPERWVKQLVSHLGRRLEGSVDETTGVGRLDGPGMSVTLEPVGPTLVLEASAEDAEGLDRITDVVGSHLQRFAASTEELAVRWIPAP
ncbi:DUF2218 domain-containing protein [Geodermatophilus sabuli]|uniref:DUF2218 domain-containing protein n=1 Tax=Geodermatophilus sabuli TaxID=1564158 RepID=A0A7K3VVW8_9ACTN|nr:DUF2218 domain-containing protein [Geodermatophilus sabuli]NEK56776.1 DUF2218 domain-containing protein [Geodermatophilus sabuli]